MSMDHPRVHPAGTETPAGDVEMGHQAAVYPPLPTTAHDRADTMNQQHLGGRRHNTWAGNDANTLLVVAALITTLTYQLGTNLPGGYWQDTKLQEDGRLFRAGDPVMRDLHTTRYWVFMVASWMGLISSMLMTLSLLMGMAVDSRHVRCPFVVAYSSLILTFAVSGNRTSLPVDIAIWLAVLAFFWLVVSFRQDPEHRTRILQVLRCNRTT